MKPVVKTRIWPPRTHLKIREWNGRTFVLCKKNADGMSMFTDNVNEVSCKMCLHRIKWPK